MPNARTFFSDAEKQELVAAIRKAEQRTSGEIRLHLEEKCKGDAFERALVLFKKLKMDKTAARNGVLFYLATGDKKFAIVADAGINDKVPANFWDGIKNRMQQAFKQGDFLAGVAGGLQEAGEQLETHFPFLRTDSNELSDDISFHEED
jgi:uncharacterized membrane protein